VGQPMIPATFLILVKTLPRIALVALLFAALAVGTESMLVSPQH
jgi:ABC-type proline/glycine betaine transport system permease subunit